jgi:hypothetical protein
MAQRKGPNKWDITLDGNKYKILKGEESSGYQHAWQHVSVNEQERFSPITRGNMQSRPDLRGFVQSDWSGGQTWFKPTLPNQDGDTFFSASLFDTWSKPGNLLPLNDVTDTPQTALDRSGHILVDKDGDLYTTSDVDFGDGDRENWIWNPASNNFIEDPFDTQALTTAKTFIHSMLLTGKIDFGYTMGQPTNETADLAMMAYFSPGTSTHEADYISPTTGVTGMQETWQIAPGSSMLFFDGELMVYNGDTIQLVSDPGGFTPVTDDGQDEDMLWYASTLKASGATTDIVAQGSINLAVATERGIYYVKNVRAPNGLPQARIFRVEVTDAGTYVRSPVGTLPDGMMCLNIRWHMDSLLMITTTDWGELRTNDRGEQYLRTQLWHYTRGSIGAVGTFDGAQNPAESPLYFNKMEGTAIYIASDQRMWVYDATRGGLHQAWDYPTSFASGYISSAPQLDSAGDAIDVYVGNNRFAVQKRPQFADPKTGSWAAGSYTLVSNYINFGVDLEDKQLTEVVCLFEKGTSAATFFIDIQADDSGSWTTVATMTGDNGGVPISTDITANNLTGNRFQYRIRYQVSSGTERLEFRGIKLSALSGKTVEVWDLMLDGTEIVNVENEKQDPNVVFGNLKTTAEKEVFVSFTDHYGRSDTDVDSAVDVRVDQCVASKADQHEAVWQVRLTKVSP